MSVIVAISGGKASAWCADWALKQYPKEEVILYFNDTKWEHPDLYRFMDDLSKYFNHPITFDSDGRSPEALFYANNALANNRMPFCSRILKAERLQKFYQDGDALVFGIGLDEPHRANRLVGVYQTIAAKKGKWPKLVFPLIRENTTKQQIDDFLNAANIQEPLLYRLGFLHNNCFSGDTLFLTDEGWRSFEDSVNETVKVLGTRSRWVDATIKEFGKQSLMSVRVKRHGSRKEIRATKDHIWLVWDGNRCKTYSEKPTSALKVGDRLVTQYPKGLSSNVSFSTWGIAHGFTFGDGTVPVHKNGWITPAWVRLCGNKDKAMLPFFNNSPYREVDGEDIIVSGLPRHFKNYPDINESKSYLAGWLSGYFAADGSIDQSGTTIVLCSSNREHLQFAKQVADKVGFATGDISSTSRKGYHEEEQILYKLSFFRHSLDERFFLLEHHKERFLSRQETENLALSRPRSQGHRAMVSWVVEDVSDINVVEKVYCAVVPDGHKFTIDGYILTHNCSGGCVRAGKKHWKLLYEKLPEVYADRERVEREMREYSGRDISFFKDETLEGFRGRIERRELSSYYDTDDEKETECIGICSSIA